jgi:predicted phage terminase large subunit-like protein
MASPKLITPRAFIDAGSRQYLKLFVLRCFQTLHPGTDFKDNWHVDAIVYQLERIQRREINRLIINLPPRYAKSLIASIAFAAFILGHDPAAKIFGISYSDVLTRDLSLKFKAIIESDWYQGLFPELEFSRVLDGEVLTSKHGFRKSTSVFGSMTGMGGDYFIIDDPMKPTDALSDAKRDACNAWYGNVLFSRLDDKKAGVIIIVMQRLHMHDLCGFLTDGNDDWEILNLAAVAECEERIQIGTNRFFDRKLGEALHPNYESIETLAEIQRSLGSTIYAAQYQQTPVPEGGAIIKRHWLHYYDGLPTKTWVSKIVLSWDTATKGGAHNAYSVCTVWFVHKDEYWLIDLHRGQFDYPQLKAKAIELAQRYKPNKILIEDASTGAPLAQELKELRIAGIDLIPVNMDKAARLFVQAGKFEAGRVHFPKHKAFMPALEAELLSFPQSRTKDQVDSITQALAYEFSGYSLENVR